MSNVLARASRKVRHLLFKPTNWYVIPGGDLFPGKPTWWAESRSRAGHFHSGPFLSVEDAIAYCERMNG